MKFVLYIFMSSFLALSAVAETEQETINKCLTDLSSEDVKIRRRAALVLCKYPYYSVYRNLIPLISDKDEKIRQSIIVGFIENRMVIGEATLPLMRRLGDSNVHTRRIVSSTLLPQIVFELSYNNQLTAADKKILLNALKDKDAIVRKNMLLNFYSLRRLIDTSKFVHLLGDENSEIRLLALNRMFSYMTYENLEPYLKILVKDKSVKIRKLVLKNLGYYGTKGREYLKVMAEDEDSSIAARAMALTGNTEYLPQLKKIILDGSSPSDLVVEITQTIVNWSQDSVKFTYTLLTDPLEYRRYAALNALRRTQFKVKVPELLKLVKEDSNRIRRLVFSYLYREELEASAVSQLALSEYSDVREFILGYITSNYRNNRDILDSLYDLMLDEEIKIRALAVKAVWECKTDERYDILKQSLTDSEKEIRNIAARLLLESNDPKAASIIKEFQKQNEDGKIDLELLNEENAASSLGQLLVDKPLGWREEILKAFKSKSKKLQRAAADVIIESRDPLLVDAMMSYFKKPESSELRKYLLEKLNSEQ